MDEIEAQAISDTKDSATDAKVEVGETKSSEFRDYSLDDSEDEEAFLELYSDEGTEEEQGDDDDVTLSEAEFKLVLDRVNARYNRFVERLRARNKTVLIKDYTAADFVDSDDEEISQVISVTADFKPCGHADDARVAAIQ